MKNIKLIFKNIIKAYSLGLKKDTLNILIRNMKHFPLFLFFYKNYQLNIFELKTENIKNLLFKLNTHEMTARIDFRKKQSNHLTSDIISDLYYFLLKFDFNMSHCFLEQGFRPFISTPDNFPLTEQIKFINKIKKENIYRIKDNEVKKIFKKGKDRKILSKTNLLSYNILIWAD